MKGIIICILFLYNCNFLIAQKAVQADTSNVVVRSFDYKELQELKNKDEFNYDRLREPAKSLWDRFWQWIWWQVREILRTKQGRTTVWSILLLFGIAAIIFFVIKVLGMNRGGLFGRSTGIGLAYTTTIEDINHISFEAAIKEAIESRNFRLATRLLYLQSLKQLSDKGYIDWQINKTNTDYIQEVAGKPWQALFKKLTCNFEYIWYGEMNVPHGEFQHLQVEFQQLNNQLQ
jgi:hypothetical protein